MHVCVQNELCMNKLGVHDESVILITLLTASVIYILVIKLYLIYFILLVSDTNKKATLRKLKEKARVWCTYLYRLKSDCLFTIIFSTVNIRATQNI